MTVNEWHDFRVDQIMIKRRKNDILSKNHGNLLRIKIDRSVIKRVRFYNQSESEPNNQYGKSSRANEVS